MDRRLLPIGIQTFREIRESNCYYVDKTGYALRLARQGKYYFLSRPRRFGKSLFVDTLKALFEGHRDLFADTHAADHWDWSVRYPVVRLDFSAGDFTEAGYLQANLRAQFDAIEEDAGMEQRYETGPERFKDLLRRLHRQSGQRVAVLVDEYDKPILDALQQPDIARSHRDYLRGLYSVIKACDSHIRFCFLTGVSRFSKVSLFSGLNNLIDITLEAPYSAICGYTEEDLDTVFATELRGLDRQAVREWYNGYNWGGEPPVYNPFDLLLLFRKREFNSWWFQTGTPTFLVETLIGRNIPITDLDGMLASEGDLGMFDIDGIAPEALLFQTGYLTLGGREMCHGQRRYRLVYPNREVRQSLTASLLTYLTGRDPLREKHRSALGELLASGDLVGLERRVKALYESIPYEWHTRNEISRYEGYYASVFFGYVSGLDVEVTVEDSSNRGRLDMAVRAENQMYLFDFKLLQSGADGTALAQLKERDYAAKYRHLGVPIHLVGVEFNATTRTLVGFETAIA